MPFKKYGRYRYAIPAAIGSLYNMGKKYYGKSYMGAKKASKPAVAVKRKPRIANPLYRRKPRRLEHSSTAQPIEVFKHGRKPRLSRKFVQAVRSAISSTDTYQKVSTQAVFSNIGECTYSQSPMLLGVDDVYNMSLKLPGTVNNTSRFTIKDSTLDVSLVNQSNGVVCLQVYECQCRHDVPFSASYASPLPILADGWSDAGYAGNVTDITSNVFSSPAFTTWFKVIKVHKYELNGGETKHIMIKDSSPFTINKERIAISGVGYNVMGFRKRSKFLIFQQWGQAVNDQADGTHISTDRTKIDFIYKQVYDFTWVDDFTNTVYKSGSLDAVTTARFVQEASGTVI